MKCLYTFYDANCDLCYACRKWIEQEPKFVPIEFVAYQSHRARKICPRLKEFDPSGEIVVMADTGEIYRGGKAWIMCLYALRGYREWALLLARPGLLPVAKRACHLVSQNRLTLSKLFRGRSESAIRRELESTPPPIPDCPDGKCKI